MKSVLSTLIGAIYLAFTSGAVAVGVNWQSTGGLASGESVVHTDGTLAYAYNLGNATTYTANTVPFKGTASGAVADLAGEGNVLWSPTDNGGGANFSNLTGDFGALLDSAAWGLPGTATTITLNNLTEGQAYLVQVFSSDTRAGRSNTLVLDSGTANEYSSVETGSVNSGAHVTGTFVADATQQATFTFRYLSASGNANINAIQVRKAPKIFVHPGMGVTAADLAHIKANLAVEPWLTGYNELATNSLASLSYVMRGPFVSVGHTAAENRNDWREDMRAVHHLARMWYFTDDPAYAQKARDILIAWATTHTTFLPGETYLDMGYHAHDVFEGAEILRGTWPGWTQADTDTCKTYFENVWWNSGRLDVPGPLRSANQGMAQFAAALGAAVFLDDEEKFELCLHIFRTDAAAALLSSLPNGQIGDSGRDAHDQGQLLLLAWCAEVFWTQGVDVFSEYDNRLLAAAEYISRFNLLDDPPFIQAGTVYDIYPEMHTFNGPYSNWHIESKMITLLHNAYVVRKGMRAPYLEQYLSYAPQRESSFCYLNTVDASTAFAHPPVTAPADVASVTALNSTNMGDATNGSASYSSGVWTVRGRGTQMWYSSVPDYHFAYLPVTGDATIIAQLTSLSGGSTNDARAGLVFSSDLTDSADMQAIIVTNPSGSDPQTHSFRRGDVAHSHQGNSGSRSYPRQSNPKVPYWLKIERIGNRVNCYSSPDGVSWSCGESADYAVGATAYFGLAVSSDQFSNTATATFTHVRITGGDGGEASQIPPAPFAIHASPGGDVVPLRWLESFEADSYKIWRSTQPGGPYTLVAQETGTSWIDTTVNFGTHYYYAVSAVNALGESPRSPEADFYFPKTDWYEAEDYDAQNGIRTEPTNDFFGGRNLSFVTDGDWTRHDNIPLEAGAVFRARVAGNNAEIGQIEVRLDSPTGTLVGTVQVIDTGGWQNWGTVEVPLTAPAGVYDLHLVYTAVTPGTSTGFNVNWFDIIYPGTTEYDLGMDIALTVDPATHVLTNCSTITAWDAGSTYLKIQDGSDLSGLDFSRLGVGSWATTDFDNPTLITTWGGANLNGITLVTDGNFGAGDDFEGADFSNVEWGAATSTADPGRFFSGGSGASSAANAENAIRFLGADLSLVTGQARTAMINNLGGFDGGAPVGAIFDPSFLANSGWDKATLIAAGWQYTAIDAFAIIEGEDYDGQFGVDTQPCSEGGLNVQVIQNGDWCAYHNVDFGGGAAEFQARVASNTSGGNIEIRLGSPTGTLVGTCVVNGTNGWQSWTTVTTGVSGVSGVHDVYLVFTGGGGYLMNLNWFTFTPTTYTLTYTAGSNGSISGTSPQTVIHGSDGSAVTAVAAANYDFVDWSDGRTDNPRTDLDVTGDLTVTANFVDPYTDLEDWRFVHFGTHANTGVAADDFDADMDGVSNLIEYATGTNPNIRGDSPLVVGHAAGGSGLEVVFERIADPSLNYVVEGSDDLSSASWNPVWSGTGTSAGMVTIPDTLWPSGHSYYFFRLGVSR